MPTLLEQFRDLLALMEEGTPLEQEFERQVGKLISGYADAGESLRDATMVPVPGGSRAKAIMVRDAVYLPFKQWVEKNFRLHLTNTPRGGKPAKAAWERFDYYAKTAQSADNMRTAWEQFKPILPQVVQLFSDEGKAVTREIKTSNATYINMKGLPTASFKKYVQALDRLLGSLKGWRRKALAGELKVALAGKDAFRGTSSGRYNEASDTLLVKASPAVMKRSGGTYGAPDYILIHELGHRYEKKNRVGDRFEQPEWITTPYSMTDSMAGSEKFAELFALGHFGIRGAHGREFANVIDRFERKML